MREKVILIESFDEVDDVERRLYLEIMMSRFLGGGGRYEDFWEAGFGHDFRHTGSDGGVLA
ncbi:hypothetical protein B9Q04_16765 [Candidatus Marsarchaeota G2 archaeon BE_D]|jgi:hypothetical protein|uniref:Uncharacterized protein n=1 Tax=Candidatus Marsarchaeota G2 archaeon BE_D TaxID=1978158 RepID=A0A2R6C5W4_9ARCH|nr:MAG: hypothetical protein B9Q04_16765 [Candidatus Marsarchaeota G2 archaeon BE_D]